LQIWERLLRARELTSASDPIPTSTHESACGVLSI